MPIIHSGSLIGSSMYSNTFSGGALMMMLFSTVSMACLLWIDDVTMDGEGVHT